MSDVDDQTDELVALASIYDDSAFTSQTDNEGISTGVLKATVEVPRPFSVILSGKGTIVSCVINCTLSTLLVSPLSSVSCRPAQN